jgi:hypothetical protein
MKKQVIETYSILTELEKPLGKDDLELIQTMESKYPQMTGEFKKLCIEQYLTFLRKQNDYGPANIAMNTKLETEQEIKLSLTGLTVRLNDKISRLVNLILLKNKARNESVEDTFLDLSVYGKIALVVMRGKWAK